MPDLLERGAAWLDSQRAKHLTRAITYAADGNTVAINATVGKTTFEQSDEFGRLFRFESRDFIVTAADLVLGGVAAKPKAGAIITDVSSGVTRRYEVAAPGGEPPWRYSDPYYTAYRIHTKAL